MSTQPKHRGLGRGLDALIKAGGSHPGGAPAKAHPPAADAPKAAGMALIVAGITLHARGGGTVPQGG